MKTKSVLGWAAAHGRPLWGDVPMRIYEVDAAGMAGGRAAPVGASFYPPGQRGNERGGFRWYTPRSPPFRDPLPFSESDHIQLLEMWGLVDVITNTHPPHYIGAYSDNGTVVARALRGSRVPRFQQMARDLAIWLVNHNVILLWVEWVWTEENIFSDAVSRWEPRGAEDTEVSRAWFSDFCARCKTLRLPVPSVDVFANPRNAKTQRFIACRAWAEVTGCVGQDFFASVWPAVSGEVLWCFPPPRLIQRAAQHIRAAADVPAFVCGPKHPSASWIATLSAGGARCREFPLPPDAIVEAPEGVTAVRNPQGPGWFRVWVVILRSPPAH